MAHLAGRISACLDRDPGPHGRSPRGLHHGNRGRHHRLGPRNSNRDVSGGQYRLYGSGTAASPYYWVWVPTGVTAPAPPTTISTPTVAYPGGRYQLQGNGTAASPHYWVWVPAGSTVEAIVPAPPPLPAIQTTVQPAGQYQLYGNGTAASPYYWVWIPSGSGAVARRHHRRCLVRARRQVKHRSRVSRARLERNGAQGFGSPARRDRECEYDGPSPMLM